MVDPEKQDDWSQKNWEDLLLKMLSKSLDVVDHEEWIAELGEAFGAHIPMYARYPEDKVIQIMEFWKVFRVHCFSADIFCLR